MPSTGASKWANSAPLLLSLWTLLWMLHVQGSHSQTASFNIRFCVPEVIYDNCLQMANILAGSLSCVRARDKLECMNLISRDLADIVNVDPEDLYLAGRLYNLEPFAMEEYESNLYRYRAGVLIPKNSDIASLNDLRGKRSCHTGVGRTAGWNIPLGLLLSTNTMTTDCRGELYTAANFFGRSCAAGSWSPDPLVDQQLKREHPSLCSVCKEPISCSATDEYSGYEGAIKCLLDGQGQVAFTTIEAVEKYFRERGGSQDLVDEFQFLCLDGTRMPIHQTRRACDWARRPTNVYIIRKGKVRQKEIYLRFLQQIFFRYLPYKPSWFSKVLVSSNNVTQLVPIAYSQQSWDTYLGNYIPSIEKPMPGCERKNVTMCTTSTPELAKCLDMQKTAYARRIRPDIRCINPGDSRQACIEAIKWGRADVISLDAGLLYNASRYNGLTPIAAEKTNHSDAAYYAVAVVRVPSQYTSLAELRGARSCHTGFGRTEGWVAPIGALLEQDLIPRDECNRAASVAKFFGGSCVPGAADYRYNPNVTGADALCKICAGDENGEHSCERGHSERFEGEGGAFRCLAEGRGEVAFVNHYTPFLYTDGRSREFWARGLRSDDFRLLCRRGGQGFITEYEKCNIAKIPTHFLAVSENILPEDRLDTAHVLTSLSHVFTRIAPLSFRIFGPYQNYSDLVFSDVTTNIVALTHDTSYREALGSFFPILQDADKFYCENFAASPFNHFAWLTVFAALFAIFLS